VLAQVLPQHGVRVLHVARSNQRQHVPVNTARVLRWAVSTPAYSRGLVVANL